jgi:hypothetical protein
LFVLVFFSLYILSSLLPTGEGTCVLGINDQPVEIKPIEAAIIDKGTFLALLSLPSSNRSPLSGFEMGWMQPKDYYWTMHRRQRKPEEK